MRKNEVPQDDANMLDGKTRELQYALDEDGNYVEIKSVGWEPKNIVMQQAWDEVEENIKYALEEVEKGNKSPIFFFMYKNIMDVKILAEYTGFWVFSVKRHLKPNVFKKLPNSKLENYREVFKLDSINDLVEFDVKKELEKIKSEN